ncbi:pimeloyl-ACP methyl ester carboxylesterase [Mesorhizobium robiniae]|uniref:Pimeloyl-ACP methyl ester carboxylesterase n=1 Tax=Mesorhizobium robiniae TaxID=559315 RepID=A0ABV2GTI1_9HYPH
MPGRSIQVEGLMIAVREAGPMAAPAFLLLHGWPQSSHAFEPAMERLSQKYHVIAPDLPGIGGSFGAPKAGDKKTLARLMKSVADAFMLDRPVIVGHDVGGQVVFSMLRNHRDALAGAVIMDVAIPGISPWEEVVRNPQIWHFAFHAVPRLPEELVTGHERAYFDFFFDALSKDGSAISSEARDIYAEAYSRPESLKAGFDWYRAFAVDARENTMTPKTGIDLPVLYLRGSAEPGAVEDYLEGLRSAGLTNIEGGIIPDSGHFAADENPGALVERLVRFREEVR